MDESSFEIDSASLAEAYRRFPAHRLSAPSAHPDPDVTYLATDTGAEFGCHVWDEGGHS
ncbi:hypothetical protein [Aeromicrobium sp.]|uniref:hypothetical protein n=1 Tax=Aeromicrobium sp. TaxID=1871063 RepID=UPI00198B22FE|nr:hypothetical protein [Aeromicrobium sp.]MBC7630604.1 hypothetical protein [Aeromicrobium sp.]